MGIFIISFLLFFLLLILIFYLVLTPAIASVTPTVINYATGGTITVTGSGTTSLLSFLSFFLLPPSLFSVLLLRTQIDLFRFCIFRF